jgi:hypothetical protein
VKALQPLTKSGRRTGSCSGAGGGQYKPGSDGFLNAPLRLGNHRSLVSLRSRSALVLRTAETQDRQENDSQKNEADSETDAFAEAFRHVDTENNSYDDVDERDQHQNDPPGRSADDLAPNVEVVNRDDAGPPRLARFRENLPHRDDHQQRDKQSNNRWNRAAAS